MTTRIRYMKNSNILTNRNNLLAGTYGFVTVHIDLYSLDFVIVRVDNGQRLGAGKGDSMAEVKKNVKTMLSSVGVIFQKENRRRKDKNESLYL